MRSGVTLVRSPEFTIRTVVCRAMHIRWSVPELAQHHGVVLVRAGRFRLRHKGRDLLAEPTTGYLHRPGAEIEFSHPAGGDVCTSVALSSDLWPVAIAESPAALPIPIDGRLDLAHRRLLQTARAEPGVRSTDADADADGDHAAGKWRVDADYAVAEILLLLLQLASERLAGTRWVVAQRARQRASNLVFAAKDAILANDPAARGLLPLARRLAVSPAYLSRLFHAETGMRLTRYRNRVRVGWALDRIEDGEQDLAALSAELGFADQAHMTRTIKAYVGAPPAALRRILQPGACRDAANPPRT